MAASAPNSSNTPDPRPTGDLEHLFRQKFAEAEVTPRASFWDQLDHELIVQQNEQVVQENVTYRRRLVVHRWVAAACLLLALGFGSWAFLWQDGSVAGPELAMQLPSESALHQGGSFARAAGAEAATPVASQNAATGLPGTGADQLLAAQPAAGTIAGSDAEVAALLFGAEAAGRYQTRERSLLAAGVQAPVRIDNEGENSQPGYGYRTTAATSPGIGSGAGSFFASFSGMQPRAAQLRNYLGLLRPDTLKPSLLAAPQLPATSAPELAAVEEPERKETPKLWRRLRLGGGYAVGSYNPNVNFSQTDGRLKADPVTNALRSYYQDEAEDEYRRNLRAGVSQRAALLVSYALTNHWTLTSGAEVAEQQASSATTYGFVDGKQVGPAAADLFNRPAAYSPAPAQPRVTSYRYRSASVPVGVRYGSTKQGLSLYAKVGAAVSVLLSSRSEVEGTPEATRNYSLKSTESPYRQVLTSVRGGTGVRYQPTAAAWSLVVGPTAEAGLNTLNAHPSQRGSRQSRPYSIGLEASVEFGTAKPQPLAQ
ncbi:hypothetical protein K3G63_12555 [Hymenobacter sp. HSC-4F20]|uniref:hypothetical protein n=1 Tax=Hymenobacter sp. HSC-4F20 TaxID=2864135 RepID=UPI001C72FA84|nr:hypothetical protein [Hymenobacter sp. HSC-4F20]MBX0291275.1 hypothetical protein [Hymenobacter sp. HSC-4F20]